MNILAVCGCRKNGNTHEVVKRFERSVRARGNVEFDYLFLSDIALPFCVGCHNCIFTGEDRCPHAGTVQEMEEKILEYDGIVLASPGYMFSVTGIMKNFLDHVAYNCHRPKYFGRKAFILSSCTKWQTKSVFAPMETWAGGAGFRVSGREFAEILPFPLNEGELGKIGQKIDRAAGRFLKDLGKKETFRPNLGETIMFRVFRAFASFAPAVMAADHRFFEQKGAYRAGAEWYGFSEKPPRLRHRLFARTIERGLLGTLKRITDGEKLKSSGEWTGNRL